MDIDVGMYRDLPLRGECHDAFVARSDRPSGGVGPRRSGQLGGGVHPRRRVRAGAVRPAGLRLAVAQGRIRR